MMLGIFVGLTIKQPAGIASTSRDSGTSVSRRQMTAPCPTCLPNFSSNIADGVLRDVYVRGKYRDVILPMTVIRRLDALLEQTKGCRSQYEKTLDAAGIANQEAALCQASGEALTPRLRSKT